MAADFQRSLHCESTEFLDEIKEFHRTIQVLMRTVLENKKSYITEWDEIEDHQLKILVDGFLKVHNWDSESQIQTVSDDLEFYDNSILDDVDDLSIVKSKYSFINHIRDNMITESTDLLEHLESLKPRVMLFYLRGAANLGSISL